MKKLLLFSAINIALCASIFVATRPEPIVQKPQSTTANVTVAATPKPVFSASTTQLVAKTNEWRAANNVPALAHNPVLDRTAAAKCNDMQTKNYWAHNAPDGTTPWTFFTNSGYTYKEAGENLARGMLTDNEIVSAWKASPTHNENLLSAKFTQIGFGICEGPQKHLVVQHFGRPQ